MNATLKSKLMKRIVFAALIACMALFVSCEKENIPHTGDTTGTLYGVWTLTSKTETLQSGSGQTNKETDYTKCHFFLALSEFPMPHAIAKKGSFTELDLDDVDVDAVFFTYNAEQKKISFKKTIWLSDEALKYNMILNGTFDVLELTDKKLVIQQTSALTGTVTYTYSRYK